MTLAAAILVGYAMRGRLSNLTDIRLRWGPLALLGLGMQLLPLPEAIETRAGVWILIVSFVPLTIFVWANLRSPGAPAILLGLLLNFAVIGVNLGMPVSAAALRASGQEESLQMLKEGGIRHELAGPDTLLRPLGDVIPVGGFVHQAVSAGDVAAYAGAAWMLVVGMRGRRREGEPVRAPEPELEAASP